MSAAAALVSPQGLPFLLGPGQTRSPWALSGLRSLPTIRSFARGLQTLANQTLCANNGCAPEVLPHTDPPTKPSLRVPLVTGGPRISVVPPGSRETNLGDGRAGEINPIFFPASDPSPGPAPAPPTSSGRGRSLSGSRKPSFGSVVAEPASVVPPLGGGSHFWKQTGPAPAERVFLPRVGPSLQDLEERSGAWRGV